MKDFERSMAGQTHATIHVTQRSSFRLGVDKWNFTLLSVSSEDVLVHSFYYRFGSFLSQTRLN